MKYKKGLGWALIAVGIDFMTPPYPSTDAIIVLPVFLWYYEITTWQQILDVELYMKYVLWCILLGLTLAITGSILLKKR